MNIQQTTYPSFIRWLVVPVVALLSLLLVAGVAAQLDFGLPVPGQRVYDRTGLLTAEQVASLEQKAAAVEAAGAPAFVYLQPKKTDYEETVDDARQLMDEWDIQSAPDARDGIVIFFNLEPDDLEHGDYALVAGATLLDGNLPQRELDRITDQMQPMLEDGDIPGAIGLALEIIERDLREGPPPPPPPSRIERISDNITDGAFSVVNVIAVFIAAAAAWLIARAFPKRHTSNQPVTPATAPPDNLPPALAGALVTGSVSDANISATILDLASRGALAIEPDGKKVRIRLLDESLVRSGFEEGVWRSFAQRADAEGIVADKQIGESRKDWGNIREVIKQEMLARGWFDPNAGKRRTPFYIAAVGLTLLAVVALIFAAIAESLWALPAVAVLGIAAIAAFAAAVMIPNTTRDGDEAAAPWRGYQRYLKSSRKNPQVDLDLDTAVPYAVALGVTGDLDKRLKTASAEGYLPAWLGVSSSSNTVWATGFYPYWIAFNSSVTPTSTGTAGTGGASAGSGASGGSF